MRLLLSCLLVAICWMLPVVLGAREYELRDDYGHTIARGKSPENSSLSKGDDKVERPESSYHPDDNGNDDDDDEDEEGAKVEKEVRVSSSPDAPSFIEMSDEEENDDDDDDWEDESKVRKKVALNTSKNRAVPKTGTTLKPFSSSGEVASVEYKMRTGNPSNTATLIGDQANRQFTTVQPSEDAQAGRQVEIANPGDPYGTLMVKVYRGPTKTVDEKPFASWGYFIKYPTEKR